MPLGHEATTSKVLNANSETKVSKLTEPEYEIGVAIAQISNKMGLKEAVPEITMKDLVEFIQAHYGDMSVKEVELAFDLATAEKLDLDYKEIEHYQVFSQKYLGKILSAYRRYRQSTIAKVPLQLPEKPISKEESERLAYETFKPIIINHFNQNIKQGKIKRFNGDYMVYEYLYRRGIITLTNELKTALFQKAKVEYVLEMEKSASSEIELMKVKKKYEQEINDRDSNTFLHVQNIAKGLAVRDWMVSLVKEKKEIERLL